MKLSDVNINELSPAMQEYAKVKLQYPRHIVFYRLGDFYEMFFEDAQTVSRELEITLTGHKCGLDEKAPMCGVPYHAAEIYIKKLIDRGYNVVICEQTADPATCKGLVPREVVRVVTPGTVIESSMLEDDANNYLCCIYCTQEELSACFADISTGEVHLYTFDDEEKETHLINEVSRYIPSEIIMNDFALTMKEFTKVIKNQFKTSVTLLDEEQFSPQILEGDTAKQFSRKTLEEIGIKDKESSGAFAVCGLFGYIKDTQKTIENRFGEIKFHINESNMVIGFTARRNLELTETLRSKEKKGSLIWVLDKTKTSMGKRRLKAFMEQPLINPTRIMQRLDAVQKLAENPVALEDLSVLLKGVYDIERLMTRVIYKKATPVDLKSISLSALKLPEIKAVLETLDCFLLDKCNSEISTLDEISNLIENAIADQPPTGIKDGGVIKDGFNEQLDKLRNTVNGGTDIIDEIQEREREATGIKNLKIGYNRVFGYYIEVTKSFYDKVPENYIRKQTLANCERFITDELKNAENTILSAKEKIINLEQEIFAEVREFIASQLNIVSRTANAVGIVDVLCSFAKVSTENNYVKPEIAIDGVIDIKNGRHPVVEKMQEDVFVPNDVYIDQKNNKMMVITGPNMSGKSTFMRQVALITFMAQIGCFVPADYAKISVVDQIFTRIGASDDLTSGKSTFMVEMSEVADIIKHATSSSLVILDEVGRGTSTSDGLSIAWAVAEHMCSRSVGCKTLFATHYHELTAMEDSLSGVKNYSVAVSRVGDDIKFLHKIVSGGADESYGIEVAKLAGLPNKVINRAKKMLAKLEKESQKQSDKSAEPQISFDGVGEKKAIDALRRTNIDELNDSELRQFIGDIMGYLV